MSSTSNSSSTLPNSAKTTPPWRSTFNDSRTSRSLMPTSRNSMLRVALPSTATTSFRIGLKKSSKDLTGTNLSQVTPQLSFTTWIACPTSNRQRQSIGFLLATSTPSKIKNNAVPAGLSPPLVQSKPPMLSHVVNNTFTISPSNNKCLATPSVQAAMEAIFIVHGTILSITPKSWTQTTPTHPGKEWLELANITNP